MSQTTSQDPVLREELASCQPSGHRRHDLRQGNEAILAKSALAMESDMRFDKLIRRATNSWRPNQTSRLIGALKHDKAGSVIPEGAELHLD